MDKSSDEEEDDEEGDVFDPSHGRKNRGRAVKRRKASIECDDGDAFTVAAEVDDDADEGYSPSYNCSALYVFTDITQMTSSWTTTPREKF